MTSPIPTPRTKRPRFHYAWVVAIAGGLAALIGVEPMALFGVFLGPISDDLGVSRGVVSSVYWVARYLPGHIVASRRLGRR